MHANWVIGIWLELPVIKRTCIFRQNMLVCMCLKSRACQKLAGSESVSQQTSWSRPTLDQTGSGANFAVMHWLVDQSWLVMTDCQPVNMSFAIVFTEGVRLWPRGTFGQLYSWPSNSLGQNLLHGLGQSLCMQAHWSGVFLAQLPSWTNRVLGLTIQSTKFYSRLLAEQDHRSTIRLAEWTARPSNTVAESDRALLARLVHWPTT